MPHNVINSQGIRSMLYSFCLSWCIGWWLDGYLWVEDFVSCQTGGLVSKESACNARDPGSIPGSGSSPGEKKMKESEVFQSCPTLYNHMDCSLPGFSIHGIFQARVLEWVAISFFKGSSQPRDWTQVSLIGGRRFTIWATRVAFSPGEGTDNPLQYSCLKNAMDRGAWWATVLGVVKSQTPS